ncbi:MAG: hypothetical protein U0800_23760 [Isosphaeraceae bacterium]
MRNATLLRTLLAAQVASITFIGIAARGDLLPSWARFWGEAFAAIAFYPVLLGFPISVLIASRRAVLPAGKRFILIGIEAALGFAAIVAILPAVQ